MPKKRRINKKFDRMLSPVDMIATPSSEKDVACIGAMNRCVAHGARLVLAGLIAGRSPRAQNREGVTLQAQHIELADSQVTWVV